MVSAFYIALPARSIHALISSILTTLIPIFLGNQSDPAFWPGIYTILAFNFILWTYCKNYHRFNRVGFLHQNDLEKINKIKEKILVTLAHDIRSPLSVILMRSDFGMKKGSEEDKKHFDMIYRNTKKIDQLISELLTWTVSNKESQKAQCIKKTFVNSLKYVDDQAQEKNITLENNLEEHEIIHAPVMMESVFRNLLTNAIKFSPENSIIHIDSAKSPKYCIKIHDKADRIDESQKEAILRGDNQESHTGTSGEKGTGIGLKLVHTFLKAHEAQLDLEHHPLQGNIFSLTFH